MRADERDLLVAIAGGESPRLAVARLGVPRKRASYLFDKWTNKGWYGYGVSEDLGWLTDAGREAAS